LPMGGRPIPLLPAFLSTIICRRNSGAVNEPALTDLSLCRILGSCYSESIRAGYPCRPVSSGCAKSLDRSSEPPRRALLRLIKRARPSERHSRRLIGCGQRLFARANVTPSHIVDAASWPTQPRGRRCLHPRQHAQALLD
jgi:hypothetical protein